MSSAFINSLGSSFGSLTTTQTKSQSRTKKKTTQSGKIVVKKNMTAQGYLIRADANAMKNSDAGKTAIAEAQKIADAIENKGTLKISRLKKEQQLRQKKQIEESCGAKKKAALTSKQLKKKKRARKAEERADAANAITPYKKQTEENNESNSSFSSDTTTPGIVIDVAVTADTGCVPADASSVDVCL